MPVLSVQFQAKIKLANGSVVQAPPAPILVQRGPVVQVSVSLGKAAAAQLIQSGGVVPAPVAGLALIDTGASSSCVDDAAATQMKLPVIDVVSVASASHAATQQNVYPLQIELSGTPIVVAADRAIGAALAAQGLLAIIGRDVLQHGVFIYNGTTGSFSVAV